MLYRFEAYKSQRTRMDETPPPTHTRTHSLCRTRGRPGEEDSVSQHRLLLIPWGVAQGTSRSTGRGGWMQWSQTAAAEPRGRPGRAPRRGERRPPGGAARPGRAGGRCRGPAGGGASAPRGRGGAGAGAGAGAEPRSAPLRRGFGRAASAAGSGREASGCRGTAGQRPSAAEVRLLPGSPPLSPCPHGRYRGPLCCAGPGAAGRGALRPGGAPGTGSPTGPDGTRRAPRGDGGVGAGAVEGRCKGGARHRVLCEEGAAVPGTEHGNPGASRASFPRGKTAALGRFTGFVAFVSIWWMVVGFRQLKFRHEFWCAHTQGWSGSYPLK